MAAPPPEFEDFFDNAPVPLHWVGPDGTILRANRAELELLGYDGHEHEYIGRSIKDFHVDRGTIDAMLRRLAGGETLHKEPAKLRCRDGSIRDVEISSNVLFDENGRFVHTRCFTVDVSDRRRAERAALDSEERYRKLAELLPIAVYTCEAPSGRITYFNEQAVRLWGRTPESADDEGNGGDRYCGSHKLFLPDGTFLPHDVCPVAVALSEGRRFRNAEVFIERPDGTRAHALANIDPIFDAEGRIVGAINAFHDISALKQTEQALRRQKEDLQTLLDTVPVAVLIAHDPGCRRISGNRAAAQLLRMPLNGNFSRSAPPEERPTHFRYQQNGADVPLQDLPMQRAARGVLVKGEEFDAVFNDGTACHAMVSAQPLFDEDGAARGAVACMLDITAHKKAEAALREADRRKDEFLATLSHELRNPLAPIRTALTMLDRFRDDTARFAQSKAIMERQVAQLVRLIEDLLDVARISRGKIRLRKQRVELTALLRDAIEASRPDERQQAQQAQQAQRPRQPAIEVDLPEQPIDLHADPVRLAQVFGNLLSNAYKYTDRAGSIRVSASVDGDDVRIAVRDSGLGIPSDQLDTIFHMFSQVDLPDRASGGLGIGLSLARRLVELHGGTIEAHSEGLGRGSEFVVRLPLGQTARAAGGRGVAGTLGAGTAGERRDEAAHRMALGRRILVVDDNVDAAETLAMLLEADGHVTEVVHDGLPALEKAKSFRPSVILLDIGLPGVDGYEICRRIRREPWGRDVVIAALTGWGQEEDRRKSIAAGFDAHLVKPVEEDALRRVIEGKIAAAATS